MIFLLPLTYSPELRKVYFVAGGTPSGFRPTASPLLGHHIATYFTTLAIGAGVAFVEQVPQWLNLTLTICGTAHMLWLAARFVRKGRRGAHEQRIRSLLHSASSSECVLVFLLNPEARYIIAKTYSRFLYEATVVQSAVITLIAISFTITNLIPFVIWTGTAVTISPTFTHAQCVRWINNGFPLLLAPTAMWVLKVDRLIAPHRCAEFH